MFSSSRSTTSVLISIALLLLSPTVRSLTTTTTVTPLNSLFALNVKCTLRSEVRDEWLALIQDDQSCSRRDEPGCLQFVLGQDADDKNTFYLFELYANSQAFQHHCKTAHFETYVSYVESKKPYACEPELFFYHPFDEEANSSPTKRQIRKNAFGVHVNLYPKASFRGDFLKVISENKKGTDTTEPLALQYTYGEATVAPGAHEADASKMKNVFHFHEQYCGENRGKEGFDAHASAPHFAAWKDFVATDPFDKAPEVSFFHVLERS